MTATPATASRGRVAVAALLGAAAVAAVFALAVLSGGGDDAGGAAAATGAVSVAGEPLPRLSDPASDPAVGVPAPRIEGADFDGAAVAAPGDGRPTVLLFLAHWCPACQVEVPRVQAWIAEGSAPADIALVAVSTGVDPERDNYPPAAWFEREGWTVPTIVDDAASQAAEAYGLPGYPYWVFLDGDGVVLGRHFGGLDIGALEGALERLRELSS